MKSEKTQALDIANDQLATDTDALSRWLTTAELTERTGLSVVQVRNLETKGVLPSVRKASLTLWHTSGIGKLDRYMVLRAELKALQAEMAGKGEAAPEKVE